jgi:hypothetical protein
VFSKFGFEGPKLCRAISPNVMTMLTFKVGLVWKIFHGTVLNSKC